MSCTKHIAVYTLYSYLSANVCTQKLERTPDNFEHLVSLDAKVHYYDLIRKTYMTLIAIECLVSPS